MAGNILLCYCVICIEQIKGIRRTLFLVLYFVWGYLQLFSVFEGKGQLAKHLMGETTKLLGEVQLWRKPVSPVATYLTSEG